MMYVVTQVDPVDHSQRVVGVFDNEPASEEARFIAERAMSQEDIDAGIYYSVTNFKVNKLYV